MRAAQHYARTMHLRLRFGRVIRLRRASKDWTFVAFLGVVLLAFAPMGSLWALLGVSIAVAALTRAVWCALMGLPPAIGQAQGRDHHADRVVKQ